MATAAPVTVHREIAGFRAISEQGHWLDCGIVAEIDALRACAWFRDDGRSDPAMTSGLIKSWHNEYAASIDPATNRPRMDHGTQLHDILWHLTTRHPENSHIAGHIPSVDVPNLTQLRTFIKYHTYHLNPVIVFVSRAYNLPHNEAGVGGHFVTLGGIDSELGYLVANGDTTDALANKALGVNVPTYWATWAQLTAAHVNGAIALDAAWQAPVVTTPPPAPPAGDSSSDALALAQQALNALQALITKLGGS